MLEYAVDVLVCFIWSCHFMKITSFVLACLVLFSSFHAEAAKRFGGGKSIGKQSSNVTQRETAKPAQPAAPNATPSPASAAPAAAQRRPWGAMLGGLAAGLGLAWLAHSLGFGAEFGQFLMFGLIALILMVAVGYFMRRRPVRDPYAYSGGNPQSPDEMRQYNPAKIGNDSSARPWEHNATNFESATPSRSSTRIGSALMGSSNNWQIPEGFDAAGFVAAAKANFISLQAAWDKADIPALRAMMTDTMLAEIQSQLAERAQLVSGPNTTDVVMLEAQLLGIEDLGEGYMASVEFSGMIREDMNAGPSPFREVWNMTRPKQGQMGWLVAGVQALQ
jgi:predicted lipid-binding transport protein (Tim44 family)